MGKELSASALQIAERKVRMDAMKDLALEETKSIIYALIAEDPEYTNEQLVNLVKAKPIPINGFKNEYKARTYGGAKGVSDKTATEYFNTEANRLHPLFIRVPLTRDSKPYDKRGFHVSETLIYNCVDEVRTTIKQQKEALKTEVKKENEMCKL